ncbi:MAG: stage V sporulation protein AD [Erysipelotrichaceae bacterium]|nr:stage V sporulation protein AD [Erysipelotrichaceae bacterium]
MRFKIDNAYLKDSMVLGAKLEGEGPISKYIDYIGEFKDSSFENSEIDMLTQSIDMLKERLDLKDSDIDLAIGGELSNQLTTTSYTLRKSLISLIGIYSACSTISLGLGLAGLLLNRDDINNILVFTSSHNQSAERQFRNPVEYGGEKENTQTFTSTIAASALITSERCNIKLSSFTLGKVIDIGFTDSFDFGRAMAPAALETLLEHFKESNTTPNDYDLVLTGDLSSYGYDVVNKELNNKFGHVNNYNDCGLLLYDIKNQNVIAGGSGPGTSAGVLLSYVKKKLLNKEFKRVLLCATGVLMNPTMINQKNSLPCIAHAIELECVE